MTSRRAARRGQGGRLTTLNFRQGAVTTLNLGHVSNFLSGNISRTQTRQYRKSTKEATSGKRCERKGETNNCSKQPVSRPNNASSDRRSLQKCHRKQSVCSKFHQMWGRQSRRERTYVPRYLCSPVPMVPGTYMFPGTYVPRYLCSPICG